MKQRLPVKKPRMTIFHTKLLHSVCIRTLPGNLDMDKGGVTTLLPPLHTTVVSIIVNRVQRVGQITIVFSGFPW